MKTHFKVVVLDQTRTWCEAIQRKAGGAIFRAYLFDALRPINCCELTPSYELWPLYTTPWKQGYNGSVYEEIRAHEDHEVIYMDCDVVDKMDPRAFFDDGEEDLGDDHDEWEEIRERTEERLRGNVMIEFPAEYQGPASVIARIEG